MATATKKRGVQYPDQDFTLPEGFRTEINVNKPAHEQRHDDPSKDYGIGCAHMVFRLIGPKGAIEFDVFTGWYLAHVAERLRREPVGHYKGARHALEGHAGATYFHQHTPMWDDQEPEDCKLLGGPCYCDVGYTIGDDLWEGLVTGGEPGLWKRMKALHDDLGESS